GTARLSRCPFARSPGDGCIGDLADARECNSHFGVLDLRRGWIRPSCPRTGTVYDHRGRKLDIDTGTQAMPEEELLNDLRRGMDGAMEGLRKEFGGLRTGRASASLLEPVMVSAYGNSVPLNQVASINVPEPRLITVQVWDRGVVKAVDKAIRES